MPPSQEQEDREHELRMDQMTVDIEKMRPAFVGALYQLR